MRVRLSMSICYLLLYTLLLKRLYEVIQVLQACVLHPQHSLARMRDQMRTSRLTHRPY
jgi:hypothetical protein